MKGEGLKKAAMITLSAFVFLLIIAFAFGPVLVSVASVFWWFLTNNWFITWSEGKFLFMGVWTIGWAIIISIMNV